MGRARGKKDGKNCSYVVGRYKGAGNVGGKYKKNVVKGSFTKGLCDKLGELIKDIPPDNSDSIKKINGDSDNINDDSIDTSSVGTNVAGSDKIMGNQKAVDGKEGSSGSPFDENGLQVHNRLRALHGSTDMKIDPNLSEDAELYAKQLATIGSLRHAQLEGIGENLAYGCSSKEDYELSAAEAIKRW